MPIAFRRAPDGTITPIGRKYELLVGANLAATSALPPPDSPDHMRQILHFDNRPLQESLDDIVGTRGGKIPATIDTRADTLLSMLIRLLLSADPATFPVARSCGLQLKATLNVRI